MFCFGLFGLFLLGAFAVSLKPACSSCSRRESDMVNSKSCAVMFVLRNPSIAIRLCSDSGFNPRLNQNIKIRGRYAETGRVSLREANDLCRRFP